ncbi:MAG: hypothetical protein JWP12_1757 [Bacteroidetes bacterium]|nr:hypothetical protein [Bacteroidota bacterium]
MDFHLSFPVTPFSRQLNYSHSLLFVGSCFAENIGEKMQRSKFNAAINPHGILYNPASMAVALKSYMNNTSVKESDLFFANDCWNSWEHHSRFSNPDKAVCFTGINNSIEQAHLQLKNAKWLFVTFGSAFIYTHTAGNKLAGNCHKVPNNQFVKSLLSADEIIKEYTSLIAQLKEFNPDLNIVFTVSPVRYIRDGVVENNLSKAVLIQSVHALVKQNENAFYFPAYELIIDDLRDYRFYKPDLVHPTQQAIDYVFEKLMDCSFDGDTKKLFEKISDLVTAMEHRPFNKDAAAFQKFKATYLQRAVNIQEDFPSLDLKKELEYFGN